MFDRGEGAATVVKRLTEGGSYHFGIDPQSGYWELFSGDPPAPASQPPRTVRITRTTLADIRSLASPTLFLFEGNDSQQPPAPDGGDLLDKLNQLRAVEPNRG